MIRIFLPRTHLPLTSTKLATQPEGIMPDNKKTGRSNKAMTFFVCFLAALAGLLFGLDIGVIAGALPFITDEFQITPTLRNGW